MTEEDREQINVVTWFKYSYRKFKDDIHHIANQRQCSIQRGRQLKKMGVTKGISDLLIAVPRNNKCGLWLELKTAKGRLSKEQQLFLERKNKMGYVAVAAWGQDAAMRIIKAYLAGLL